MITVEDGLREDSRGIYGSQKPVEVEVYGFAFRDWLSDDEIITNLSVTVPSGLTKVGEMINAEPINDPLHGSFPANTVGLVWITGGTPGTEYALSFQITTNSTPARIKVFDLRVKIK